MNKKQLIVLVLLAAVSMISISFVFRKASLNSEKIKKELYAASVDITEEELLKKGYIDVSHVLEQEEKEITDFLNRLQGPHKMVLKVFYYEEDGLWMEVYFYHPKSDRIASWAYNPAGQYAIAMRYYANRYEVIEKDGIKTVMLQSIPGDIPITQEGVEFGMEELYSFVEFSDALESGGSL